MKHFHRFGMILSGVGLAVLATGCSAPAPDGTGSSTVPAADNASISAQEPPGGESSLESLASVEVFQADRSESALPYEDGVLLSHISGSISYRTGGETRTMIPQEAGLRMPTGMAVKNHWLFVADGDRVAVFDLDAPAQPLQEIAFGPDDTSVNDVFVDGDDLYTSVTGTGCIYRTNVSDPSDLSDVDSELWLNVPGPNGITVGNGRMYIASISPDYQSTNPENVVYEVADLESPEARPLEGTAPGRYDGVTLSDDGRILFFSDWNTASMTAMDLDTGDMEIVYQESGIGPADIDVAGNTLYIPDMNGGRIIAVMAGPGTAPAETASIP